LNVNVVNRKSKIENRKSAAAIMLALWALFVLSAMVISWALDINTRLSLAGNANRRLEAEAMACSGVEIAFHPLIKPGSKNLKRQIAPRRGYDTRITGEAGRLNINYLVVGEDPNRLGVLRRYLENKGIDLNERETMVDSLLDWVTPNVGLHHLNAPPESDDYHPAHMQLSRLDDLKRVYGWEEFTSQPGWDDDFTVNTPGTVDLQWASRDVLLALPGMNEAIVDRFLELRRGPDKVDGTDDDLVFQGVNDTGAALGLTPQQLQQLNGLIGSKIPIFRVVSVGQSGDAKRTVQLVFIQTGNIPQVITWKEF
jgi:general secretion pathway protein K